MAPKQTAGVLCLRIDWHRALDGAIVDVDLMVSCKAQTILQRAVCSVQYIVQYIWREMALAAVSQFRFFYRRVCKMGASSNPNGPSLL